MSRFGMPMDILHTVQAAANLMVFGQKIVQIKRNNLGLTGKSINNTFVKKIY